MIRMVTLRLILEYLIPSFVGHYIRYQHIAQFSKECGGFNRARFTLSIHRVADEHQATFVNLYKVNNPC